MKKIALLLPQFGRIPSYFDLWLVSASYNKDIDFYIISDIDFSKYSIPNNVNIIFTNFEKMIKQISRALGCRVVIDNPYKLCDYKPAYGIIFKDIVDEYDFWGHIDPDVIMGDLRKFISEKVLNEHLRIYTRGHLSLYANVSESNNYFKILHEYSDCLHFRDITKTSSICGYDEWGFPFVHGVSEILKRKGITQYDSIDFADINPFNFRFFLDGKGIDAKYFCWKNGQIYSDNGEEYIYIHLQKRNMIGSEDVLKDNEFFIYPDRFLKKIDDKYYQNVNIEMKQKERNKMKYKNKVKKIRFQYLLFRLKILFRKKGLI